MWIRDGNALINLDNAIDISAQRDCLEIRFPVTIADGQPLWRWVRRDSQADAEAALDAIQAAMIMGMRVVDMANLPKPLTPQPRMDSPIPRPASGDQ